MIINQLNEMMRDSEYTDETDLVQYLSTITAYLKHSTSKNKAIIRSEILSIAANLPSVDRVAITLLKLGDPEVLAKFIQGNPECDFPNRIVRTPMQEIRTSALEHLRANNPEDYLACLRIISGHLGQGFGKEHARSIASYASANNSPEIITTGASTLSLTSDELYSIFKSYVTSIFSTSVMRGWACNYIMSNMGPNDYATGQIKSLLVTSLNQRWYDMAAAIILAGHNLLEITFPYEKPSPNSMMDRFIQRCSTAHGVVEINRSIGSLDRFLTLSLQSQEAALAGMSKKLEKKLIRSQKRAEARAKYRDQPTNAVSHL